MKRKFQVKTMQDIPVNRYFQAIFALLIDFLDNVA